MLPAGQIAGNAQHDDTPKGRIVYDSGLLSIGYEVLANHRSETGEAKDVEGFVSFFADDASFLPPNSPPKMLSQVPFTRLARRSASMAECAYNLGNLWRRLALPHRIKRWSLTSLQRRLVKTGGRLVKHGPVFLATVGREPSDAAAVRSDGGADR